jgi:hypothetical protein
MLCEGSPHPGLAVTAAQMSSLPKDDCQASRTSAYSDLGHRSRWSATRRPTTRGAGPGEEGEHVRSHGYQPLVGGILVLALVSGPIVRAQDDPSASGAGQSLPPAPRWISPLGASTAPEPQVLVPATIAGHTLMITPLDGQALFGSQDPAAIQPVIAELARQGKSLDDVSFQYAVPADGSFAISAFWLHGGDGGGFMRSVIALAAVDRPPEARLLGDKAVIILTIASRRQFAYPKGEAFWVIAAEDPLLTQILDALP